MWFALVSLARLAAGISATTRPHFATDQTIHTDNMYVGVLSVIQVGKVYI